VRKHVSKYHNFSKNLVNSRTENT